MRARAMWAACAAASMLAAGCTSLQRNYSSLPPGATPVSTPTGSGASPTSVPTPAVCATQNPDAVIVAMVSFITATPDPTYGTINGYATESNGSAPPVAAPIDVPVGAAVQFQNGEGASTPVIDHSAVSFPGATAFPPTPYTFPSPTVSPIALAVTNMQWSTGRVYPGCYSQTLTAGTAGTFYFGDYDYYNTSNTRDVIVVGSNSSSNARRRAPRRER